MTKIHTADIIRKHYRDHPKAWELLLSHSRKVTRRALKVGRFLQRTHPVDLQFIAEAAMLHDIGMIRTHAPELHCFGQGSYLRHGIEGRELLEQEGLPRHGRVCERHIGIGLTAEEIRQQGLPLPVRDMLPETLEEQIICYADLFYSKNPRARAHEKSSAGVRESLARYGETKVVTFERWLATFEPDLI